MKKIVVLLLSLCLCLSMTTLGFAAEAPSIAGQYYAYGYTAEGYGDYEFFFRFYDEDPMLGSVFYAGLANNGVTWAGTYSVLDEAYDYACYATREDVISGIEAITSGTAPYTVVFYDWDGVELDRCGWDGAILYNTCKTIAGSGSGPAFYALDTEGKFQRAYDGEVGVSYLDFVFPEDETCTVALGHNMTYVDMMLYFIDGSWSMADGDAGAMVYTLTPFDTSEDTVTLTVSADTASAIYQDAAGDEYALINTKLTGPKLAYLGTGVQSVAAYGADAAVTLSMYDDNSCEIVLSIFGSAAPIDAGSYTMNADYSISFELDNAGALTAALNMESRAIELQYANAETKVGAVDCLMTIGKAE